MPDLSKKPRFWAVLVLLVGVLPNKWTLEALVVPDGRITSPVYLVVLFGFNAALFTVGLYLLRQSEERARETLTNLSVLAGSLLGLFLLVVLVEAGAYGLLVLSDPDRARRTLRRHPMVGHSRSLVLQGHVFRTTSGFHPLWGWQNSRTEDRDRYGFRVNDLSETSALDPGADFRVVLLGGSTVAGYPSRPGRTISAYLERLLDRESPHDYNVINAGVGGWFSVNQTAFLLHKVLPFLKPDAVVVLDGVNDAKRAVVAAQKFRRDETAGTWISSDNYLYDPRLELTLHQFQKIQDDPSFVLNQFLWSLGATPFFQPSRYMTVQLLLGSISSGSPNPDEEFDAGSVDCREVPINLHFYLANVRTAIGASRRAGVPILYALQPSIVFKQPLTERERGLLNRMNHRYYTNGKPEFRVPPKTCWGPYQTRFFTRAGTGFSQLSERFSEPNVRLRDLSKLFAGTGDSRFYDAVHYTGEANLEIARHLQRPLRELIERNSRSVDGGLQPILPPTGREDPGGFSGRLPSPEGPGREPLNSRLQPVDNGGALRYDPIRGTS